METLLIIVVAAVAVVLIAGTIVTLVIENDKKRREIRESFGPEYHRTLPRAGERSAAEKELRARQRRVEGLDLKPLLSDDAYSFSQQWRSAQARFVDDPKGAIADANRLVIEVMQARGYPTRDCNQRAMDVSVEHPEMVQNYRRAHQIAQANERGEASTEDLRQAVVHYRSLFTELLETEETPVAAGSRR